MNQPIHPSALQEPFCLSQMHDMVQSWRGTPRGRVPKEVKAIAWMFSELESALHEVDRIDAFLAIAYTEVETEYRTTLKKLDVIRNQMSIINLPLNMLRNHVDKDQAGAKRQCG